MTTTLRDLRNRIAILIPPRASRVALLHVLVRDLLRDLHNRLADEQEQTAPIRVADRAPRRMIAGNNR